MELSYYIVNKSHILSLSNQSTLDKFIDWSKHHAHLVHLPLGNVFNLESWVVEEEDIIAQEEVFSHCDLDIQYLIYQLKQLQLKENPQSKAHLAFE